MKEKREKNQKEIVNRLIRIIINFQMLSILPHQKRHLKIIQIQNTKLLEQNKTNEVNENK